MRNWNPVLVRKWQIAPLSWHEVIKMWKQTQWWSNDKTIIELGYRKISWFASVSQIFYLPQPSASENNWSARGRQITLLYSWRFSRYSAPIHWLVHGHMTSNNETVSRQMPWVGNIAKTITSNGKEFTVTREMLTAVARDRWNLSAVFKLCFCFGLLYNKSLNDLRNSEFCFPRISMFHWDSRETTLSLFPSDQSLSVKCFAQPRPMIVNYLTEFYL